MATATVTTSPTRQRSPAHGSSPAADPTPPTSSPHSTDDLPAISSLSLTDERHVVLDHQGHPDIIDGIIDNAPIASLLMLRATSKAFRDRVDRMLFRHVRMGEASVYNNDVFNVQSVARYGPLPGFGAQLVVPLASTSSHHDASARRSFVVRPNQRDPTFHSQKKGVDVLPDPQRRRLLAHTEVIDYVGSWGGYRGPKQINQLRCLSADLASLKTVRSYLVKAYDRKWESWENDLYYIPPCQLAPRNQITFFDLVDPMRETTVVMAAAWGVKRSVLHIAHGPKAWVPSYHPVGLYQWEWSVTDVVVILSPAPPNSGPAPVFVPRNRCPMSGMLDDIIKSMVANMGKITRVHYTLVGVEDIVPPELRACPDRFSDPVSFEPRAFERYCVQRFEYWMRKRAERQEWTPEAVASAVTTQLEFFSHDEYRAHVGDEQYALETVPPRSSFLVRCG